jgi:hypothetical protein
MVMRLLAILMLSASVAYGAAFTNTTSGLFTTGATWVGGTAPNASNDSWLIVAGTTVEYDGYNTNTPWAASVVNGTLLVTNTSRLVWCEMLGNISGTGNVSVGTAVLPIPQVSTNVETVVFCFRAGTFTMTKSGAFNWYFENRIVSNVVWSPLSVTATQGANQVTLTYDLGLRTNDIIFIDAPLSVQTYTISTNTHFVVADYNASTKVVTLGNNTNWIGDRWTGVGASASQWQGVNRVGLINLGNRSNAVCGVTLLSRAGLVYYKTRPSSVGVFNNSDYGIVAGLRVQNVDLGMLNGRTGWQSSHCVATGCNVGNSYSGTGHTFNQPVATGCAFGNSYSGTGHTFNQPVALGCDPGNSYQGTGHTFNQPVATGCNVGNSYSGTGHTFNQPVAAGCNVGNSYLGTGHTFNQPVATGCNVGNSTQGLGHTFNQPVATGCTYGNSNGGTGHAFNQPVATGCTYGNSYQGYGHAFNQPVATGCTYGNSYQGYGHTFNGGSTSNCTTRLGYQDYGGTFYNNTRTGTSTRDVLANTYQTDSLFNFVRVIDSASNAWWYQTTGICSAQTSVVTTPIPASMAHVATTANQPVRWYQTYTVRPLSTGRWVAYQRRASTNTVQLVEVYRKSERPFPEQNTVLAVSTNTAAAATWQTTELSWNNTNTVEQPVTVWLTSYAPTSDTNYSWVVKQSDYNTRTLP